MTIYNYDQNGIFTSIGEADQDPLDTNNWLIPANATTIEPLTNKKGFAVRFTGVGWEYIEDNRGKTVYNTTDRAPVTVDYIGTIQDGFTLLIPTTEFDEWDGKKWKENPAKKRENEEKAWLQWKEDSLQHVKVDLGVGKDGTPRIVYDLS